MLRKQMTKFNLVAFCLLAAIACKKNNAPEIITIQAEKTEGLPYETIKVFSKVSDREGDACNYKWQVSNGYIRSGSACKDTLLWELPYDAGVHTATLVADDGEDRSSASVDVTVKPVAFVDQFSSLTDRYILVSLGKSFKNGKGYFQKDDPASSTSGLAFNSFTSPLAPDIEMKAKCGIIRKNIDKSICFNLLFNVDNNLLGKQLYALNIYFYNTSQEASYNWMIIGDKAEFEGGSMKNHEYFGLLENGSNILGKYANLFTDPVNGNEISLKLRENGNILLAIDGQLVAETGNAWLEKLRSSGVKVDYKVRKMNVYCFTSDQVFFDYLYVLNGENTAR